MQMLEPTTASIGLYLIAHPPRFHKRYIQKPMFLKRVCKQIRQIKHNEVILDAIWDEIGNSLVDHANVLPSWSFSMPSSWVVLLFYACLVAVIVVT